MSNSSVYKNDMDNQMKDMCNYLEKLVTFDENDNQVDADQAFRETSKKASHEMHHVYNTGGINNSQPHPEPCVFHLAPTSTTNQANFYSPNYGLIGASSHTPMNMVTSVLANAPQTSSTTHKFDVGSYQKTKKWNNRYSEKFPNTSNIDIDATMLELGLTPESLTQQNDVHKLFSLYSDLEFSIHAEFITTSPIYDQKTIPNTMNVSAQTKYAVYSSHKLHRSLREVLKRPMPAEFKSAFNKCEDSVGQLQQAIIKLDNFKHCTLEHRKGEFITPEAKVHLQPLMEALTSLTECIEQSRMYVQIYERALNAPERYKSALLEAGYGGEQQPIPEQSYTEQPNTSRPVIDPRYIG